MSTSPRITSTQMSKRRNPGNKNDSRAYMGVQRELFWTQDKRSNSIKEKIKSQSCINTWDMLMWVMQTSMLSGNSKLISAVLASQYNSQEGHTCMSLSEIALRSGLSKNTVKRHMKELQQDWKIEVLPQKVDSLKKITYYTPRIWEEYETIKNALGAKDDGSQ